jgi:excinuclease UvrABC nuclease subunit
LFIIEGIPGVGAQKARTILSHFGSVAKVFGASRTEWLAVPGLGKAIVDRVFAVIHE